MHIVGVGVDVCDVARFDAAMKRTPRLVERLFNAQEQALLSGRPAQSYAARFAVKEAVAKVLGNTAELHWHDCAVLAGAHGEPVITVAETVAQAAAERSIVRWHCSVSHDGGVAIAFVVAEGRDAADL